MAQTLIIDIHLDPRLERLGTFIPLQYPERKKTERPQPQLSLGGTISAITVTTAGVGYTSEQPPLVIIAPPQANHESIDNVSYEGDFGIISGIKTTSVGSTDALVLDLVLPMDSVFRDANTVGTAITVSGIGSANYIVVSNTNIGHGVTSIDSTGHSWCWIYLPR